MHLAMSILVRDEADIIEDNIRHHAASGVSSFIVTDNGSVDGTRELLEGLSKEFNLTIIDEESMTIDQDLWVTRMATMLRAKGDVDWVINNDADEFWISHDSSSLPDALNKSLGQNTVPADKVGVVSCRRSNFVAASETVSKDGYYYAHNNYRVVTDWKDAAGTLELNGEESAALLNNDKHVIIRTLPGKVITRISGLTSITMGNHGAVHELHTVNSNDISIVHYPIRSYEQFKRKVINYGSSIEKNTRLGAQASLHLRRWYESYKLGTLEDTYNAIVLPGQLLDGLVEKGVLVKDTPAIKSAVKAVAMAAL